MKRQPAIRFVMFTALLDVVGIGLIIPVMPGIVGQFTHDPSETAYWYGALMMTFGMAQFLMSPLLGALSDRYGRRPLLLLGISGLGVTFALTALANSLWVVVAVRLIGGGLSANFAVAQAYVADISTPEDRTASLGKLGAMFGIGFVLGPALGGQLGHYDIRLPLFVAAGLCALNALYGLLVLPESLPADRRAPVTAQRVNPFAALAGLASLRGVGSLVVVFAAANMAQFTLQSSWVLFTGMRFGWGPRESGYSLFAVGLVALVVQGGLLRPLLKAMGERTLVLAGLASGAAAYALYGLVPRGWMIFLVIPANFLAFAAGVALQGIVSRAAGANEQGRTMASLGALSSLIAVISPFTGTFLLGRVAGYAPDGWQLGAPFYVCSLLTLVALGVARLHFGRANPQPAPAQAAP